MSHARFVETERREFDVFAVGGCESVARGVDEENGGGCERGGEGSVKHRTSNQYYICCSTHLLTNSTLKQYPSFVFSITS